MSDLVGNPEDRFSHNEAHFVMFLYQANFLYHVQALVPKSKIFEFKTEDLHLILVLKYMYMQFKIAIYISEHQKFAIIILKCKNVLFSEKKRRQNYKLSRPGSECSSTSCLSGVVRKPAFCICENKDADQLWGNHEADQRLCFRYTDRPLAIFCGCTARFVSDLVGNPEDRFSHNEAQSNLGVQYCPDLYVFKFRLRKFRVLKASRFFFSISNILDNKQEHTHSLPRSKDLGRKLSKFFC